MSFDMYPMTSSTSLPRVVDLAIQESHQALRFLLIVSSASPSFLILLLLLAELLALLRCL